MFVHIDTDTDLPKRKKKKKHQIYLHFFFFFICNNVQMSINLFPSFVYVRSTLSVYSTVPQTIRTCIWPLYCCSVNSSPKPSEQCATMYHGQKWKPNDRIHTHRIHTEYIGSCKAIQSIQTDNSSHKNIELQICENCLQLSRLGHAYTYSKQYTQYTPTEWPLPFNQFGIWICVKLSQWPSHHSI